MDSYHAVVVNREVRQNIAYRNGFVIGKTRRLVFQVERTVQRDTVRKRRHDGRVKRQVCLGQRRQERGRIDVETLDQHLADHLVQRSGKRMHRRFRRQMHIVAVQPDFSLHVLQAAPQTRLTLYRLAFQLAFRLNRRIERKRLLQPYHRRTRRIAPRRIEGFQIQAVFFPIVMVCRIQMVEIGRLLVKIFAHAESARLKTVDKHQHRQINALRQPFGRLFLFRRRRLRHDRNIARHNFSNVQAALKQLGRLPIKTERADFHIRPIRFNHPLIAVKTLNQRTFQRFRRNLHAKPRRNLVQTETQARFRPHQPSNNARQRAHQHNQRQQQTPQPASLALGRGGLCFRRRRHTVWRFLGFLDCCFGHLDFLV